MNKKVLLISSLLFSAMAYSQTIKGRIVQETPQDVFSIHDLENIKETGNINILAKTDKYVMFEAGKDFWKLNFDKEELVQYNDFISLKNNVNGNIVYSLSNPSLNKDYGIVLAEKC